MTSSVSAPLSKLARRKYLSDRDMERLREFNKRGLFYSYRHLRTRRFGLGYEGDTGRTETRQGFQVTYEEGALPFKSTKNPIPLTDLENALLCWFACGTSGLAIGDIPQGEGLSTGLRLTGRTCPGPCNDCATELMYITDDGVFYYTTAEPTKPVEIENEEDWYKVIKYYKEKSVKLMDERPEFSFDWPSIMTFNKNINRPGSTLFIPIYDASLEWINLMLHFMEYEKTCYMDGETGEICDKTGIVKQKIEDGTLTGFPIPVGEGVAGVGATLGATGNVMIGVMMQNIRLAAEAMGLGAWIYAGATGNILFGMYPEMLGNGLKPTGAVFKLYPREAAPRLIGIEKVRESYQPPFYESIQDAFEAIWNLKYGPEGIFSGAKKELSPWNLETAEKVLEHKKTFTPQWVRDCVLSTLGYVWDKWGKIPVASQPLVVTMLIQVHHLDLDFYKKYYRPEYITPLIKDHFKLWHE